MYFARWFRTEEEAKAFQKEHRGVLYKGMPRSRTRKDHMLAALMFHFDPEEFPFSVNWNE